MIKDFHLHKSLICECEFTVLFSCLDGWEGEQRFSVLAAIPAWHGPSVLVVCVGIRVFKCVCVCVLQNR